MGNFWDSNVWGVINVIAIILIFLVFANLLKKAFPILQKLLIPTSVLGGILLLIVAVIYKAVFGDKMFDTKFFGGNGYEVLEIITYHALAVGFIASALRTTEKTKTKQRNVEIFNTGVTTVSTYLLQAVVGLGITILVALLVEDFFSAAGVLLPFGYGQGTGQALNYGNIYETEYGFSGGKSFGLTIAALGFISASIGGVIYLNVLRRKNKDAFKLYENKKNIRGHYIDEDGVRSGGLDKLSVQVALVAISYLASYLLMFLLGLLLPSLKSVIYGFNFILGVVCATIVKVVLNFCKKKKIAKVEISDNYLLARLSNFAFDIMVVAGMAAIQIDILEKYWGVIAILAVVGLVITFFYNYIVAKTLFSEYKNEQFLAMYGMLTGTASTGIVFLREIDPDFSTPVSSNLVYQNFPAIIFGFPLMLLATLAPERPYLTLILLFLFFVVMNVILFRSKIFKRRKPVHADKVNF